MAYINITKFVLVNQLEKDCSITETRRLKNVVIFMQTILSFVLSRKDIKSVFQIDVANNLSELMRSLEKFWKACNKI